MREHRRTAVIALLSIGLVACPGVIGGSISEEDLRSPVIRRQLDCRVTDASQEKGQGSDVDASPTFEAGDPNPVAAVARWYGTTPGVIETYFEPIGVTGQQAGYRHKNEAGSTVVVIHVQRGGKVWAVDAVTTCPGASAALRAALD